MKVICILLIGGSAWCQTPGVHGRSATMHTVQRAGYLGVGTAEVTPDRAKALKLPEVAGVEVKSIAENSAASKASLKIDDVILEVNDQKVENVNEFIRVIGLSAPGAKVTLTVWREGAKHTFNATLEARPVRLVYAYNTDPDGSITPLMPPPFEIMSAPNAIIGFEGETLTPQLAQYFGVKEGVLVMTVMPKTPADKAGLKAGDVIVKVAETPVNSVREISGMVHAAHKSVTFEVVRNHKEITLNLELALESDPWRAGSFSASLLLP